MKKIAVLLTLLLVFQIGESATCTIIAIDSKKPITNQFCRENATYIIKEIIDLKGDTLSIPYNSTLCFKGGELNNGIIIGHNTTIDSKERTVFRRTKFEGSFVGIIKESWFPLKYGKYLDNSFELNSALNLAHLSDNKCFQLAPSKVLFVRSHIDNTIWQNYLREGTVEIKSGVTFDLNGSTIQCMTNSSRNYNILFSKDQQDICIKNGIVCGDLLTHTGIDGQWGHGIALEGVKNYRIENVECKYCWGDGVNLQVSHNGDGDEKSTLTTSGHCMNGKLVNVNCHHNRRQGMTIGGALYLEVVGCSFSNTKGSNPQTGVDIEPNKDVNIVAHVEFRDCRFYSNEKQGITVSGDSVYDILISNCEYSGNGQYDISVRGKNVRIENCYSPSDNQHLKVRFVANAEGITVKDCVLSAIYAQHSKIGDYVREVSIQGCRFDWSNSSAEIGLRDDKKLNECSMAFENCVFAFKTLPKGGRRVSFSPLASKKNYSFNHCMFDCAKEEIEVSRVLRFQECSFNNTKR